MELSGGSAHLGLFGSELYVAELSTDQSDECTFERRCACTDPECNARCAYQVRYEITKCIS
jgi:hypothetical protein